eukprot:scaffold288453_cov39-Prasinocladus_malaysianus.AAC.1
MKKSNAGLSGRRFLGLTVIFVAAATFGLVAVRLLGRAYGPGKARVVFPPVPRSLKSARLSEHLHHRKIGACGSGLLDPSLCAPIRCLLTLSSRTSIPTVTVLHGDRADIDRAGVLAACKGSPQPLRGGQVPLDAGSEAE